MDKEKPDYGNIPGNQTPNTPHYDESEHRGRDGEHPRGRDHRYGHEPGNQTPNTPDRKESEEKR